MLMLLVREERMLKVLVIDIVCERDTLTDGDTEEVLLIPNAGVRVMLAVKDRDRDTDEV